MAKFNPLPPSSSLPSSLSQELPPIMTYGYVPNYNDPSSPDSVTALSPEMQPSPAQVPPSPISPQPSPPAIVPNDVKPIPALKRVKVEATDCGKWEAYHDHERIYYGLHDSKHVPMYVIISFTYSFAHKQQHHSY